jgi:tetratricopeptide (TPR) repeat protein
LDSWKEIAAYMTRHVTTVRRWEKQEGLPVHRHVHSTLGSVYAYASELDAWLKARQPNCNAVPVLQVSSAVTARFGYGPPPPPLTCAPPGAAVFLGREREIEILRSAWVGASRGQQHLVLITGEAGQGKTRLALEFARSVAQEGTALIGAFDREALTPFSPFVAMLQWLARATDPQTLQRILKQAEGSSELTQLVPELAKALPHKKDRSGARFSDNSAESRRFQMFEAFAQLVVAISRDCPTLFLIEDMHWADTGSLLFLRHLLRSTRDAAICVLATYREDEPGGSEVYEDILREFRREFAATRIALHGLTADNVRHLVKSWTEHSVPQGITDWISATTEGNPLFVAEMLTHLGETGSLTAIPSAGTLACSGVPEGIRQLVRRRFARLSPASKRLLDLGAVIGREFVLPLLEALTDLPEDDVLGGLEQAIAARLITETPGVPGRFSFTHALIRETLYGDMVAARRIRVHHRVALALERLCSGDGVSPGELAYHFSEAAVYRDAEKAVKYAVQAAEKAYAALALEDAARYYGMALHTLRLLPPGPDTDRKRVELHTSRGRILFQAGQWASAKAEFEAALALLNSAEEVTRCELLVHLAEASFWLMDVPAVRCSADEAELLANRISRNDLWADARAWSASAEVAEGNVQNGIDIDKQTLARVGGLRSFALTRVPLTLYWAGHTAEAIAEAERAVEAARASGDPGFLVYALQHLGVSLSGGGRYDESLRSFDEAHSLGRQCGAFPLLARATSMSVAPLLSLGDFAGAANRAMEARELAHRVAFEPPLVSAGIDLLLIFARTHDVGRAEPLVVEVEEAAANAGGWHAWKWKMRLAHARAELALERGDPAGAIAFVSDVVERSKARNRPKYQALGLALRARARRMLGFGGSLEDGRAAVRIARHLSDPALLVECLSVLLGQNGSDELILELRQTVDRILARVKDDGLRRAFLARVSAIRGGYKVEPISIFSSNENFAASSPWPIIRA